MAADGGAAAAVRIPAISSTSNTSGNAVRRAIDLSERLTVALCDKHGSNPAIRDTTLLYTIVLRLLVPALNRRRYNLLSSINASKFFNNGRSWLFQILIVIEMEFNLLNQLRRQVL